VFVRPSATISQPHKIAVLEVNDSLQQKLGSSES